MGTTVKTLIKGEEGFKEFFNVKEYNSSGVKVAKDLTGFIVTIYIYDLKRTANLVANAACTVETPGTAGQASFTVTTASTATVGKYLGRLKMVNGGETTWSDEFEWNVEANHP